MRSREMNPWRLIPLATHDPHMNMAIDEAILIARTSGEVSNTLRFYQWSPSAVSVGRNQKIYEEVDLQACRNASIEVTRRPTGGGAVFHDSKNEVTYSIVLKNTEVLRARDLLASYILIGEALIAGLRHLGVQATFDASSPRQCPNLRVNGRKISGNAQTRLRDTLLQHGTILLKIDYQAMFSFLRVPFLPDRQNLLEHARTRITSLSQETGRSIHPTQVCEAMAKGFEETLDMHLEESQLTKRELERAKRLRRKKYATVVWIYRR
ncbi:MAG: lipoate--protein ligase family protein [Aigarchaeota archaeon]|nr:lipoate--protein ligase family protein [Aigarchaeota archaeon]